MNGNFLFQHDNVNTWLKTTTFIYWRVGELTCVDSLVTTSTMSLMLYMRLLRAKSRTPSYKRHQWRITFIKGQQGWDWSPIKKEQTCRTKIIHTQGTIPTPPPPQFYYRSGEVTKVTKKTPKSRKSADQRKNLIPVSESWAVSEHSYNLIV